MVHLSLHTRDGKTTPTDNSTAWLTAVEICQTTALTIGVMSGVWGRWGTKERVQGPRADEER